MRRIPILLFILAFIFAAVASLSPVSAGWVRGYFRSDGTWVNPYYRTEPDYYKWNNFSFDNDWSDIYNDRSWYRDYGYDPEPWDDEYVSPYSGSYYDNTYDYNYDWNYDWGNYYDYGNIYNYTPSYSYSSDYNYSSGYNWGWSSIWSGLSNFWDGLWGWLGW